MDYKKIFILLLALAFYLPIFIALMDTWTTDPYYSHGFLIPLVSAYFAWRKKKQVKESDKDFISGAAVLAAGLAMYGMGIMNKSLAISATSFIITLAGIVIAFYGIRSLKELSFPLAFPIFMIPLPYTDYASTFMQSFTASSSTAVLNIIGIQSTSTGSQIQLADSVFVIGEPCSGMRTMLALFALAAVFAYIIDGVLWKKAVVFLCALPIAVAANVGRVVLVLLIASGYGAEFAMAFFHEASSIVVFIFALILLIIVARLLGCKNLKNI